MPWSLSLVRAGKCQGQPRPWVAMQARQVRSYQVLLGGEPVAPGQRPGPMNLPEANTELDGFPRCPLRPQSCQVEVTLIN